MNVDRSEIECAAAGASKLGDARARLTLCLSRSLSQALAGRRGNASSEMDKATPSHRSHHLQTAGRSSELPVPRAFQPEFMKRGAARELRTRFGTFGVLRRIREPETLPRTQLGELST
jgi:hypothetical protein